MSLSVEKNKKPIPPNIIIYGAAGLGKSTFGSLAPNPVFLKTEDGLAGIKADAFPLANSFDDVRQFLGELYTEEHNYKTLVIDSLDWLEPLIWKQLLTDKPCNEKGRQINSIEEYGYGKGYVMALDLWRKYIQMLDALRKEKDMMIIQTAHAQIKKFEDPMSDPYDRYDVKLQNSNNASAAKLVTENADIVFFVQNHKTVIGDDKKRAIGSGERFLYTEERPAFAAKNRFSLPFEIPFDRDGGYWATIAEKIPYFNQPEGA